MTINIWNRLRGCSILLAVALVAATGLLAAQANDPMSKEELKALVAHANTPEDHERLAKHFDAEADQLQAEATEHEELAAQYKANPNLHESKHPMSGQTAGHCSYFAAELHKAALSARKLAADHREMSKHTAM